MLYLEKEKNDKSKKSALDRPTYFAGAWTISSAYYWPNGHHFRASIILGQCWRKLLFKVMHYNITLLPKKLM